MTFKTIEADLTGVADGKILVYNATEAKWVVAAAPSAPAAPVRLQSFTVDGGGGFYYCAAGTLPGYDATDIDTHLLDTAAYGLSTGYCERYTPAAGAGIYVAPFHFQGIGAGGHGSIVIGGLLGGGPDHGIVDIALYNLDTNTVVYDIGTTDCYLAANGTVAFGCQLDAGYGLGAAANMILAFIPNAKNAASTGYQVTVGRVTVVEAGGLT